MSVESQLVNPSPKQELYADKELLREYNELMASPQFQRFVQMAERQYARNLIRGNTELDAQTKFNCLRGAHEFITVMLYLGISSKTPSKENQIKLDHNV
ncbi:MAG TPA: hypothetical protein PKJ00_03440 [Verrucomicrobiota bacterium]|nr:hypothetical protein [Verrucomicrobiota bacterium]HNS69000.1 hypothetical protein [Verrucomicrobiota bacterium]